jgi:tetratricopeptide (TPR) repeat protein
VPKGRRAQLHVRFADWIHGIPGAAEELVEILAFHLEQACRHAGVGRSDTPPPIERAVAALMSAAEKAERREGIREADRFYARALQLVGDDRSEQVLKVLLGRASTLNTLGDLAQADALMAEVEGAAQEAGRRDLRASALIGRANIATKQGRAADALTLISDAETLAAEVGDKHVLARAIIRAAYIRSWFDSSGGDAVAGLRRALAIAEELDDKALRVEAHQWLQAMLYNLGDLKGAEQHLMRCEALFAEFGNLRDEARVAYQLGLVKYHLGDLDEAERLGLRALDWLDRTGDSFYQLQNLRSLALCALARGELALAEERLREAIALASQGGGKLVPLIELYRCLVDVLVRQGRLGDARELGALAAQSAPEEDAYARAACLLMEGNVTVDDPGRARECFVEALQLLEEQQLPLDLGEARLAYGRALRRLGDDAAAASELRRARDALKDTGAIGIVREIERELAAMSEGAGRTGPLASS